jgi:hypothetical protein
MRGHGDTKWGTGPSPAPRRKGPRKAGWARHRIWPGATVAMAVVVVIALVGVVIPAQLTATPAGADTPTCGAGSNLPSSGSTLAAGGTLTVGQCLTSPDGQYELVMQSDGNLVEYLLPAGQAVWSSNTALVDPSIVGNPHFSNYSNPYVVMQTDGNFVMYMTLETPSLDPLSPPITSVVAVWTSSSQGTPDPSLSLQDDANIVIYGTNSAGAYPAWASNTVGVRGSTLAAGQTLQPNQFLTSDGGQYKLELSTKGVLALYSTQPYACPLWTAPTIASRSGYSATPQQGSYLVVDKTGGLDLDSPGTANPWWTASQTSGWSGPSNTPSADSLTLGADGNLVLSSATGQMVWQSGTNNLRGSLFCTGTDLQVNQYLVPWTTGDQAAPQYSGGLVMQGDCNLVLYPGGAGGAFWASNTNEGTSSTPEPGVTPGSPYDGCFAAMQTDGNMVVYAPNYPGGERALWASGTQQTSTVPFNLGAIGPYAAMPILSGTDTVGFPVVSTIHGTILGTPSPPKESNALKILGDIFDALSLVFTFVAGPLGDVFSIGDALGNALGIASIASGVGGTAVAGAAGAQSNAVTPKDSQLPVTVTTCDSSSPGSVVGASTIEPGGCLRSPNGQYELIMQTDGNLVLYYLNQGDALWASNTAGTAGAYATLQTNGNFIVNSPAGLAWQSGITSATNPVLVLQSDGNLVVYGPNAVWATNSIVLTACDSTSPATISAGGIIAPGGCLISPNKQYELIMQTDGNLVLYYLSQGDPLWATNTAGTPGGAELRLWPDGSLTLEGPGNVVIWNPNLTAANAVLALQDNGNVQEFGNNTVPFGLAVISYSAWQTGTTNLRGWSLPSGSTLSPGQYLMSPNGEYKLSMGTNGLLELSYVTAPVGQPGSYFCPMWSRPYGSLDLTGLAVNGDQEIYKPGLNAGSYLAMQTDGNAVIYPGTSSGSTIALSNSYNNPGAALYLQSDGNVVVYDNGTALWASGTNNDRGSTLCTNGTLNPGQYLTAIGTPTNTTQNLLEMTATCQLVYYNSIVPNSQGNTDPAWHTPEPAGFSSNPGAYAGCVAVMQGDSNLVIYAPGLSPGNTVVWASNSVQSSIPPNLVQNIGPFSLVNAGQNAALTQGVEIVSDSGVFTWIYPGVTGANAAADGSTAVSGVETLVGFLVFLLPLLL